MVVNYYNSYKYTDDVFQISPDKMQAVGRRTSSQIFSSVFIQLVAKWQFWSTTHEPSTIALLIISAAIGPWHQHLTARSNCPA